MRSLLSTRARPAELTKLAARTLLSGYVAFAALNAQAADANNDNSRIAAAFGNTVVATYPDGRTQRIWLHPDGAWDGISRRGTTLAGKWRLKGEDKVCLRQSKPPTLPISMCVSFPPNGAVGSEWTSQAFNGTPIRLTVQRGAPPEEAVAAR